jgi:aconitate hydratase
MSGKATIKVGDNITTDHIMPAGARLKYRSNIPLYSKFVFEPCSPNFHDVASANRDAGIANIIVAGASYGQGSSREHAALCPMYLGVRAVIAKSIERIHYANLINFGIVPFTFADPADYDHIDEGDTLEFNGISEAVKGNGKLKVTNTTKGAAFEILTSLSDRQKAIVTAGGLMKYIASQN